MPRTRQQNLNQNVIDTSELLQFAKVLQKIDDKGIAELDSLVKDATLPVLHKAQSLAARRTGKLQSAIKMKKVKSKRKTRIVYRVFTSKVKYSFHVEGGTTKMQAQPYMRPALDQNKQRAATDISKGIIKVVDRYIKNG